MRYQAVVISGSLGIRVIKCTAMGFIASTVSPRGRLEPRMDIKVSGRKTTVTDALRAHVDEDRRGAQGFRYRAHDSRRRASL